MADIVGKKKEVNTRVSAMQSQLGKRKAKLGNAFAKKKDNINSSLESANNKLNSTDFLIDLTKTLVGAKALKDYVVDVIANRLPEIEIAIKDGLKQELKELVSCNINPSIPAWFQNGGVGVELSVTDIDFYDIMKTNPTSFEGGLIYTDIPAGVNSKDFSTYLYHTIQTPTTPTNWGSFGSGGVDILESSFFESTVATTTIPSRNNIIKFTTSAAYSSKKLPEFNNNFIDTLSLFGNPSSLDSTKVIALIMEELFGSISSSPGINKGKKQIEKELETKEIIDCILNSEDSNITDNFFTFDNATLARIDKESTNRKKGIRELETCENLLVQITSENVSDAINTITGSTTKVQETAAINDALDGLSDTQAGFSPSPTDQVTIRTNFFIEIIKKLQRIVMSAILAPEFMALFAINHQIIYGKGTSYGGPIDFLKKNRKLIKNIGKVVLNMLLSLLLNLALKYLTIKLKEKLTGDEIEKAKNYVSLILSLTGTPPGIIDQIRKINNGAVPNTSVTVF